MRSILICFEGPDDNGEEPVLTARSGDEGLQGVVCGVTTVMRKRKVQFKVSKHAVFFWRDGHVILFDRFSDVMVFWVHSSNRDFRIMCF